MGGGQGALRGVWAHAERRPHQGKGGAAQRTTHAAHAAHTPALPLGCMLTSAARARAQVSKRAKKRGLPQLGTLGAGNHYAEIQVVEEIHDKAAAARMGVDRVGQVCVMIHSGSRGLGHQVATDSLVEMERAMTRDGIHTNDRQVRRFAACLLRPALARPMVLIPLPARTAPAACLLASARVRAHLVAGGAGLSGSHGRRRQLRVGEPQQHDVPGTSGVRKDVRQQRG